MLTVFEWTEDLSVGDKMLDQQHQNLFAKTNELLSVMTGEHPHPEKIGDILSFLDGYIDEHFSFEESYMRSHGYPMIDEHRALHKNFSQIYADFEHKIDPANPTTDSVIKLEDFLGKWLIHHIGEEDKKYAEFIRSQLI